MHDDDVTGFAGLQLVKYHTRPRAIYTPSTSDDAFLKVCIHWIWSALSESSVRVGRAASDGVHPETGTGLERLFYGRGSAGGFPTRRQQRRRRRSRNLARRDAGYGAGGVRRASREEVRPQRMWMGYTAGRVTDGLISDANGGVWRAGSAIFEEDTARRRLLFLRVLEADDSHSGAPRMEWERIHFIHSMLNLEASEQAGAPPCREPWASVVVGVWSPRWG
jgi:hypothetical protein